MCASHDNSTNDDAASATNSNVPNNIVDMSKDVKSAYENMKQNEDRRSFIKRIMRVGIVSLAGHWLIKDVSRGATASCPNDPSQQRPRPTEEKGTSDPTTIKSSKITEKTQKQNDCTAACDDLCDQECGCICAPCECPACRCRIEDSVTDSQGLFYTPRVTEKGITGGAQWSGFKNVDNASLEIRSKKRNSKLLLWDAGNHPFSKTNH